MLLVSLSTNSLHVSTLTPQPCACTCVECGSGVRRIELVMSQSNLHRPNACGITARQYCS